MKKPNFCKTKTCGSCVEDESMIGKGQKPF